MGKQTNYQQEVAKAQKYEQEVNEAHYAAMEAGREVAKLMRKYQLDQGMTAQQSVEKVRLEHPDLWASYMSN